MADAGAKVLRGLLDVFLLESLERAPKHGYALLREMADAFGTEPNRNRLYPLLGRMVRDGLIAERSDPTGSRTLYALTEEGAASLARYRALPREFHERLGRVWGPDLAPPSREAAVARSDAQVAPRPATRAAATERTIPIAREAPALPVGELPYPCEEARIGIEKDPRTGDLSVRLTGCPMGAYDYCPQCPVHKAVEGIRRITFS